ncbi:hypothetical protein OOT46_02550 [Aquabacterium sp. A7-Y]|uniref:hypothetical protein n=1 Tax=Aquabacterium sp. A7-Y TaxID=1349605 RepID=UPI00223CC8DE|nr:hypothetical protein [Aquabacterium sp. A7-Y]MCW7536734.1 hypothetical protein [Aquabacterium sp. A7-Y]
MRFISGVEVTTQTERQAGRGVAKPTVAASVEQSVVESIDVIADVTDWAIGAVFNEAVLGEIPIVKTAVSVLKVSDTIQKQRLMRNCIAFLHACKDSEEEKRAKLWKRLWSEDKAVDFADTILLVLMDSEKPFKAGVVGKLMAALARGDITYEQCDALIHIVYRASIPALQALPVACQRSGGKTRLDDDFSSEGLLLSMGIAYRFGTALRLSPLGALLYRHGFGGTIADEEDMRT